VAHFDGAELLAPTVILMGWALVALTALLVTSKKNRPTKKNQPLDNPQSGGPKGADPIRVPSKVLQSGGSAA
jgi:hypothetical protein